MTDDYGGTVNDSNANPNDLFFSKVLNFDVGGMCVGDAVYNVPTTDLTDYVCGLSVTQDSIKGLLSTNLMKISVNQNVFWLWNQAVMQAAITTNGFLIGTSIKETNI